MPHSAISLGAAFADAVASKDYARMAELLHPEVDFRALTPNRSWQANDPDTVIEEILKAWIEDDEHVEELISVETDTVSDRERVGYRYRLRTPDGSFLVEQQAYLRERDGRIDWVRLVCSGSRPV
jgi:ketosteroid isomerase-like protein